MMYAMYCSECFITQDAPKVEAAYVYNGQSLCEEHLRYEFLLKKPVSTEVAVVEQKKTSRRRGTELPPGYLPSDETIAKIKDELKVSGDALAREHRKFCDYYYTVAGQKGLKLDWDRTWCNWMRTAHERGQLRSVQQSRGDQKVQGWMDMHLPGDDEDGQGALI